MAAVLSPIRPQCDSDSSTPAPPSLKEENSNDARDAEETSNDGSQPIKRRRAASGEFSPSCENSNQDFGSSYFPAENLVEYKWPSDETGEYYMLQEQVSEYLGITSFKRKYPDLERRDLTHKEKLYLRELNVITETQCTLGLTALRSDEVIDLMMKEYPAKHAEYSVILQEKERQRITDHYKEYSQQQQQNTQKVEASKVPEYIKKAAKKAAEFNSNLNRERMEERRAYFDLQTHVIQVPQGKYKILPTEITKVSPYPVSLIPGQFQEYYKRYSPNELRYLPLNTALYEPPLDPLDPEVLALDSDGDSDEVDEGRTEKKKVKGSSVSPSSLRIQDSSSGNVSDGEHAHNAQEDTLPTKPKAKEKSTPKKESTKRSVGSKSSSGYKPKANSNAICGICLKGKDDKKKGRAEKLIHCSQCENSGHPSCLDMAPELVAIIKKYPWQCMECKTCIICSQPHHEEEMMFCDHCDRGYHTFCVGLGALPSGPWICDCCQNVSATPKKGVKRGKNSKEG
ncbi:PREDICTED: PHD finger protein 10 isoform X2 [Nanorana parkeri]|uniref:PHD finger protein 10 isoform X2 n=1 Tax=Nanorana parkeri TaxID=125878 RepID=UPI000854FF8C|nr:PREDICTED: PHD finger protein 10 isoform X2 [Nanorana parkeri]